MSEELRENTTADTTEESLSDTQLSTLEVAAVAGLLQLSTRMATNQMLRRSLALAPKAFGLHYSVSLISIDYHIRGNYLEYSIKGLGFD